ncbi:hypothetical protein [Trinickia sp. LjRoot230]|uniref:hypothetical protein n=1 Tax=Trinickia sp. LjRoot230 TaxID=3342288 RepID=UPI003F4F6E82
MRRIDRMRYWLGASADEGAEAADADAAARADGACLPSSFAGSSVNGAGVSVSVDVSVPALSFALSFDEGSV